MRRQDIEAEAAGDIESDIEPDAELSRAQRAWKRMMDDGGNQPY